MQPSRFFRILGRIILGLFLLLILAIVGFIIYFNSSYFRRDAGNFLSDKSGRNITLEGRIHIVPAHDPRIIIEHIKVGNPAWAKEPLMFQADKIEFSLQLRPLLKMNIVMPELIIDKPVVDLEQNLKKQANWDFTENPESTAVKAAVPEKRSTVPTIGKLQITNGSVAYNDAIRKIITRVDISTVGGSTENSIHIKGNGSYHNDPFLLEVTGGSVLELRDNKEPYPFHITSTIGKTHIDVKGKVEDPVKLKALTMRLELSGANAADLFPITGIALPPTPPYSIRGVLTKEPDHWNFKKFAGTLGNSDLNGDLSWYSDGKPPYFKANFVSNNLDIKDLSGFVGANKKPADTSRVLPDTPVDISRLTAMNADVTFTGKHIKTPDIIDNLAMTITLKDGVLSFHPLTFDMAEGTIESYITIDGPKNPPVTTADVTLRRLSIARLFDPLAKKFGQKNVAAGLIGGKIKLTGSGKSVRDILGTANGSIGIGMEGGELSNLLLELIGIDLFKAAGLVVTGDQPVPISCIVGDFGVANGDMTAQPLLIDTDVNTIEGKGNLNLKNEAMDFSLHVYPKKATLFTARAPILIRGDLKKPAVALDPKSLAARAGAATALGVLLTPPAALIAFLDPGLGRDSHCISFINRLNAETHNAIPETKSQALPVKR